MDISEIKSQLGEFGIRASGAVVYNGSRPLLVEEAVQRQEGFLVEGGPLLAFTGHHTGRSPNDKFIVREKGSEEHVWWGSVNREFSQEKFDALLQRARKHLSERDLFVADCYVGADPRYRIGVRVINEHAWHNLFAQTLFIPLDRAEGGAHGFSVDFTVVHVPDMEADPESDGTRTGTFVLIDFGRKMALIGGTSYAGEIKKSLFTLMNYLLPLRDVMPMHCSANIGRAGDTALFFGLSGTGKTTLSADPDRDLIGDDEHGWSADGVFNFEEGMLRQGDQASRRGRAGDLRRECSRTVLENVGSIRSRARSISIEEHTENTRGAYPLDYFRMPRPASAAGTPE